MTTAVHTVIASRHAVRVLDLLRKTRGGLTDFEIASRLGMYLSSVNATRNALMNKGYVTKSDSRRPSGRGGQATVWVVTSKKGYPA